MATNKDKIRASAQKYLQKGQIDKAIREFERLIEDDPKDVRTLLKIGDLHTRLNNHAEATKVYAQVATFYSEQGFFLKAVAVYKQILKLDPNLIEVNLKLAELYHQLGLIGDAAAQYRQIAQLHEQAGKIDDSITILRKMVEIDAENIASRIKLAEMCAKQGLVDEARAEFQRAAEHLKSQHRIDDYVKVAERIVHFDPSDLKTTKELANIYVQKGDPRRALAKLQVCFKANPKDVETLSLLATAFKDLGQVQKTLSVYRELGRIHRAAGDRQAFTSAMRKILAIAPDDAEARAALESDDKPAATALGRIIPAQKAVAAPAAVREVNRRPVAPEPPHAVDEIEVETTPPPAVEVEVQAPPAPKPVPPAASTPTPQPKPQVPPQPSQPQPQPRAQAAAPANTVSAPEAPLDVDETISRVLVEAEVYVKYGLKAKALEHLRKVFTIAPEHREARRRYKALLLDTGEPTEALEVLLGMAATAVKAGDAATARADLEELLGLEPEHARARELLARIAPEAAAPMLAGHDDDDDVVEEGDDVVVGEDDELEAAPSVIVAPAVAAPPAVQEPATTDDEVEVEVEVDVEVDDGNDDLDEPLTPAPIRAAATPPRASAPAAPVAPVAPQELAAPDGVAASEELAAPDEPEVLPPASAPATVDLSAELEEIRFYMEQGLSDEAGDSLAALLAEHPDHPELLALRAELEPDREPEPDAEAAATQPPVPLADVEHEEVAAMEMSVDLASELASDLQGASDEDLQVSFTDVFDEFKKGVAKAVEETDYDTHYNLGIAYKEMGLFGDAIREFELAARDPQRAIGALTMMGLCALAAGDTEQALRHFLAGLNSPSVTPKEAVALRFEIGQAYEGAGRLADAAKFYAKVHAMDPKFRDVTERLAATREESAEESNDTTNELDELLAETDAEKASRLDKNKISYL